MLSALYKIMSGNDSKQMTEKYEEKTDLKKGTEEQNANRKGTKTKFSTMVPQGITVEVEDTQNEVYNLENEEDFISATSHLSVGSIESENSPFLSANSCQVQENVQSENQAPTTSLTNVKKQKQKAAN